MSERLANPITAVTHNGKFHADEVIATAVLTTLYPGLQVIRSRDQVIIDSADIVYDVGGAYNHETRRYDHHQVGALKREDGLTRSALGLIWLHYGEAYCEGDARAAEQIDQHLVRGIDARDNGELAMSPDVSTPDYGISQVIEQLNPILEHGESYDQQFAIAVGRAADILSRIRDKVFVDIQTEDAISAARALSEDSRYAIMDHQIAPPDSLAKLDGFEYVVFPEETNDTWQLYAIRTAENPYMSKRPFPKSWAGLRDEELARQTGVAGALFCHVKRFLVVAASREDALILLAKALE